MNYQLISQCPLFRGIPIHENEKLLGKITFQIKNFVKKGEVLVRRLSLVLTEVSGSKNRSYRGVE